MPESPSFRLDGRRAIVTGAGRGIGLALASALADAGAFVTLCARNVEEITRGSEAIRRRGHYSDVLALDVTDVGKVRQAISDSGPYDILVNNAGMNRPCSFAEVSVEDFDAVMELNVRGAFFTAQAVANGLIRADKPGSIINISSQMGHVGGARRSVYCASKWAVEGFTRAMAIELGSRRIRVNTLCPTFIETPMTKPFLEVASFKSDVLNKIKLGRIGTVEDLTGAVIFLASDASSLMTGSSLMLDGGWSAD